MSDYKESMKGIYTSCVNRSTIDESAFAYKKMDDILKYIADTVEVVDVIKPIYNFKACSDEDEEQFGQYLRKGVEEDVQIYRTTIN